MTVLFLLLWSLSGVPSSQPPATEKGDKTAVKRVIVKLFDAMRASDSTAARTCFHPDALLGSIVKTKEGVVAFRKEPSAEGFIAAVGSVKSEVWDERIGPISVTIDGDLAVATMPYSFFRGNTFSHCGMNAFMLMRTTEGWKIISITDTRRKERCK